MCTQNLKFVASPNPEIIGGTWKNWAVPEYAHAIFSLKFLTRFCSDGLAEITKLYTFSCNLQRSLELSISCSTHGVGLCCSQVRRRRVDGVGLVINTTSAMMRTDRLSSRLLWICRATHPQQIGVMEFVLVSASTRSKRLATLQTLWLIGLLIDNADPLEFLVGDLLSV